MIQFVAIACDCCGVHIMCPVLFKQGMGSVTPQVQLPVEKCPTCHLPFDPMVHTLALPVKHKMPVGGDRMLV